MYIHNNRVYVNGACIGTGTEVSYTFKENTWTRTPHHPVIDFINKSVENKEALQEEWLEEAVQMIDQATYPILKRVLKTSLQTNESPLVVQEKLGLRTLEDNPNYDALIEEELIASLQSESFLKNVMKRSKGTLNPPKLASEITKYIQMLQTQAKKHR